MVQKPIRPVRRGGPAPPIQGRYKVEPEDFVVEEVPAYAPSGEGTHAFVWVEKRGLSTLELIDRMAAALGRDGRDVGYAGLKDAHAVTRQWVSLEHVDEGAVRALDLEGVRILDVRRHGNKLKAGHLRGNRFTIRLRGTPHEAQAAAAANLAFLAEHGAPNWFGEQRFGKRGANLEKGLTILHGNPRRAARAMPKRLLRLLISAVQSEAFNRVLARRLDTVDRVAAGDVAFLHHNGACFVVADAAVEQERCARFELSPSGPLPGPRMLRAQGAQAALEDEVLRELRLSLELFGAVPGGTNEGDRRPLRIRVVEPHVLPVPDGLQLSFELTKGAYATSVLRELLDEAPWFAEG